MIFNVLFVLDKNNSNRIATNLQKTLFRVLSSADKDMEFELTAKPVVIRDNFANQLREGRHGDTKKAVFEPPIFLFICQFLVSLEQISVNRVFNLKIMRVDEFFHCVGVKPETDNIFPV